MLIDWQKCNLTTKGEGMKSIRIFAVCVLALVLSACGLTRSDTNAWLNQKHGPVTVDMTGDWDAGGVWSGGWGKGTFVQEGNRFSGTLGLYYAEGVVSGNDVYLVIYSGRKVYYTALLRREGRDRYIGKATAKTIVDGPKAKSASTFVISMKRKEE
jgi:hypothetical protein